MPRKCFFISNFGEEGTKAREHSDETLRMLKRALTPTGFDVPDRGDKIPHSGVVTDAIIKRIAEDDLVIADLTYPDDIGKDPEQQTISGNPNVYYELALRHATQKPVIHIAFKGQQIPFNLKHINIIWYGFASGEADEAKDKIRELINEYEKNGFAKQNNQVSFALSDIKLNSKTISLDNAVDQITESYQNTANHLAIRIDNLTRNFAVLQHKLDKHGISADKMIGDMEARIAIHHQFAHKARDLCVMHLGKLTEFFPSGGNSNKPAKVFEDAKPMISSMLEDVVRIFSLMVDPDIKVWASLRERRNDSKYHTFLRAGKYSTKRIKPSKALYKDSVTLSQLKQSFSGGRCVILTGQTYGPDMWEPQPNDKLKEDLSVLMSAVMAKSWNSDEDNGYWSDRKLMMVFCVCADREDAFGEIHIPLMQCLTDVFSLIVNILLRTVPGGVNAAQEPPEETKPVKKKKRAR